MLSVVVSTNHEAATLPAFATALSVALGHIPYELFIANDPADDEAAAVVEALKAEHPIQLISRGGQSDQSLRILDGVKQASFDLVMVMDLSHPPEVIPDMLAALEANPGCLILGNRFLSGSHARRDRSALGVINTGIARPLTNVTDPTSGFLLFERASVEIEKLKPLGDNLTLELLVRGRFKQTIEVSTPTTRFRDIALSQQLMFLRHARRLYLYRFGGLAEFVNFGMVGASGFVIDITFYFLLQYLGLGHVVARALSFWPAVSWNWALNRISTFGEREKRPKARQWVEFVGSSLFGFALNWGTYTYLTGNVPFFDQYKVLALVVGIASASFFNFAASSFFVYSDKRKIGG